ncbi:ABC transporter permease [Paenarthrobacter sp. DKR-5]|uniref:ABC transporter permease subunit n=1 Tax=Paenarthrobacter sp. DKR-5 TaxID=2835535 RepID=UPI001BDD9807|nr:ABC transporter permease subunit [Paenarthrobacter sp. DKR-5]MBT1002560.1 ABC transporter permease [Paenarthrobacter sp. DKR-5]
MLANVFLKTLHDQRRSLPAWIIAVALLVATYVALWPSIKGQPSMNEFLAQMPEAFRSLFATSGADMSTPVGYIQIELMSFMAPIVVLIYTIGAGSGAVAGEEDRHTMEMLLANPVGRTAVVLEKFAAMVVGSALIAVFTGASLVLEGALADMSLPAGNVAAAMVHLCLLGLVFGSLALALSAWTGRTGISKGVPAAAAIVGYIVNGLAPLVDWLKPSQKISPFYQYIGHDPLRAGLSWGSIGIAAATVAVLVGAAVVGFRRRDVGA